MKKNLLILLLTVTLVISLSAAALADDSVDAKPTSSTVLVNGKKVAFDAYNINGNNYFKLRDLAYTLSGTAKQFEIDFNSESNGITITGAKPYTAVGGEMKGKGAGDKSAIPTNSKIYFGDKEVRISAYNIENNNYFKLRDVGAVLDFGVDWDAAKNTIVIDTSKVYSPVMPINANVPNWNEIIGSVNGVDIFRYEYDYYLNYFFSSYYESMTQYQSIDQLDEEYLSEFFSSIEEQAWESTIYAALVRQMAAKEYYINLEPSFFDALLLPDTVLFLNTNRIYPLIFSYIVEEATAALGGGAEKAKEYYEYDPAAWDCRKVAHIIITAMQMAEEAKEKGQDIDEEKALEAAKKRAEDIITRLAKGEDFAKLAADFSGDGTAAIGGEMDVYFNIYGYCITDDGAFDPLFAEGAYLLKNVGDTSKEPVESSFGYHIIKLLDKKEGFEAVKEYVGASLQDVDNNDVNEYFLTKMQNLQDNAVIVRNFEFKYYVEPPKE